MISYEPGRSVVFEFESGALSEGFVGTHRFDVVDGVLIHRLEMDASLFAALRWYGFIEPMHDALVEDAFDRAEGVKRNHWTWRVRVLRWFAIRRFAQGNNAPAPRVSPR